jgi:hypothetical protein
MELLRTLKGQVPQGEDGFGSLLHPPLCGQLLPSMGRC